MVIFKYEMRNHRKYIWGWAISLAVCIFLMIPVYYSLLGGAESTANPLYDMLGETDFFQSIGVSMEYLTAPLGIYSFLASFFMLAAGIFGMNFGISIHTKEFSGKTSEYLFTKPHTRKEIFCAKAITVLCGSVIVGLTFMLTSFLSLSLLHIGFGLGEFILISNLLLLVSLLLAALGVLIGVIFSNNRSPLLTAGLMVFSEYCISGFSRIVGNKGIGFCCYEYLSLKDSLGEVALMLSGMPRLLTTMFGVKGDFNTAPGWYSCIYFWVSILAFVYALNLGISCIAKEVENRTSAYPFTKPVCRIEIVFSKIIASAVNLLIFSAFSGLCNYALLILPTGGLEQPTAALTTTIGLYLTQLMFFTVGLLISSIVKKYKAAIQVGTVFLLASYFLAITAQYSGIRFLDLLSPLRYFDVYEVTLNGIQIFSLILAFLIVAVCLGMAAKQWEKREL